MDKKLAPGIEQKEDGGLIYRDSQGNKFMESFPDGNDLIKYYEKGISETGIVSTDIVNPRRMSPERLKEFLDELTDEERADLFTYYCHYCGTKDVPCRCWDDT